MGMNDIGSLTHKMELQKSYCVCSKVQAEGILQGNEGGNRKSILRELCERRGKDYRSGSMPNHIHLFGEIPPKIAEWNFWDI